MKAAEKEYTYTVSPRLQFLGILISSVLLFTFFYKTMGEVLIRDQYAPVISLTPQKLAQLGGTPAEVNVGLFVRDFPKFDPVKGDFTIDATVWFTFDPRLLSIDRLKTFTFDRAEVIYKSEPYIRILGTDLFARFDMRIRINTIFDYRDFPFDDHRINLTLVHDSLSPAEVIFVAGRSNLDISPDLSVLGWRCIDWRVVAGFAEQKFAGRLNKQESIFPRVVFSLDFERFGSRHIVSIFIPLLMIFFMALFTFSFDPNGKAASSILPLSATAITALIAYRFVIENMSPPVGYFMASDYIFLVFLSVCLIIFCFNVFGTMVRAHYKALLVVALHAIILASFLFTV